MNWFIPTGWNSRKVIEEAGLIPMGFDSLPANMMLDVAFDGADEVDEELNCIKGGGACLFQEKLVACRSKKFVCIAGKCSLLTHCSFERFCIRVLDWFRSGA